LLTLRTHKALGGISQVLLEGGMSANRITCGGVRLTEIEQNGGIRARLIRLLERCGCRFVVTLLSESKARAEPLLGALGAGRGRRCLLHTRADFLSASLAAGSTRQCDAAEAEGRRR
jgi:hypothetical protein